MAGPDSSVLSWKSRGPARRRGPTTDPRAFRSPGRPQPASLPIRLRPLFCLVLLAALGPLRAQDARPLAIVGADLVDVRRGRVVPGALVLIQGRTITYAGPAAQGQIPDGARLIQADGQTVIPGLLDLHTHVTSAEVARLLLAAGVTTVRELGSPGSKLAFLSREIEAGRLPGPKIVPFLPVSSDGQPPFAHSLTEEDRVDAFVRLASGAAAPGIKIFNLPPPVLELLLAESRGRGLRTAAHVDRMPSAAVIRAGVDTIEHIFFLPGDPDPQRGAAQRTGRLLRSWRHLAPGSTPLESLVGALKAGKTALVPTLAVLEATLFPDRLRAVQPDLDRLGEAQREPILRQLSGSQLVAGWGREEWRLAPAAFDRILQAVGVFQQAGIPILAGSDNLLPGFGIHRELELLVQAGMRPGQVLRAATLEAARHLGETSRGLIEAGKDADLLILEANPLQDIGHTRRISYVIRQGAVFRPEDLLMAAADVLRPKRAARAPRFWPPFANGKVGAHPEEPKGKQGR